MECTKFRPISMMWKLINLELNKDFQIDLENLKPYLNDENLKIIFICSPIIRREIR